MPIATAADSLVSLLGEGAQLLLRCEQLQAENVCLAGGVASSALGGSAAETQDADFAAIDRLLPLLSESDALRAERESLQAERAELVEALGDGCVSELVSAGDDEEDTSLAERMRAALADVSKENQMLTIEVSGLQEENGRLRNLAGPDALDTLARQADAAVPEAITPSEPEDNLFLQQQALATVLGRLTHASAPKSPTESQELIPEAAPVVGDFRDEQMRDALHQLYKDFGK